MIPLAIFVGLIIMACARTNYVTRTFPTDYAIPMPPAQGDANPETAGTTSTGSTGASPVVVAPAYSDPSVPLPPASNDVPDAFMGDPWAVGGIMVDTTGNRSSGGTGIDQNPSMPVKVDPVAFSPEPMTDPQFPVPTVQEQQAAAPPQIDTSYPVPTAQTDPDQFPAPPVLYASDPENPIDNWTATTTDDTVCPPDDNGGVQLYLG